MRLPCRLKELERENTELKKMLAEEMLKNRVFSYVCEKICEPGSAPGVRAGSGEPGLCSQRKACQFLKLARSTFNYHGRLPTPVEEQLRKRLLELLHGTSALWLQAHRGAAPSGRLACG